MKKYKFKSLDGAVRRVKQLEKINAQNTAYVNDLIYERDLLARLAAEEPMFSNPLEVWNAKHVRDRILKVKK